MLVIEQSAPTDAKFIILGGIIIQNTKSQRWVGLISGLILNAFGNALTISANMGSAVWTASAVNYSHWFNLNVGIILFFIGFLNTVTTKSCCDIRIGHDLLAKSSMSAFLVIS